jgi:hypothetical protein
LNEHRDATLRLGIVFAKRHEHADAPHPIRLLRPRNHPPRRRTAKSRDELPPPHP